MANHVDNNFYTEKAFDLYSHIKCNVKCTLSICEIHDSLFTTYCFQCKRAICEVCRESFHSTHPIMEKKQVGMSQEHIKALFGDIEALIAETEVFSNPEKMNLEIKKKTKLEFEKMFQLLDKIKELRFKEIDYTFSSSNRYAQALVRNLSQIKKKVVNFFDDTKNFFFDRNINDDDSLIFLQIYDFFNDGRLVIQKYIDSIKEIKGIYEESDCLKEDYFENIIDSLEDFYSKELGKDKDRDISATKAREKSNLKNDKPHENKKQECILHTGNLKNKAISNKSIDGAYKSSQERLIDLYIKISTDNFSDLGNKCDSIKEHIENFKESVFTSFKKNGSMIEIEKLVKMYEEKTTKRINFLEKSGMRFSNSTTKSRKSQAGLSRSKALLAIKNPKEGKEGDDSSPLSTSKEKKSSMCKRSKSKKKMQLFALAENEWENDDLEDSDGHDEFTEESDDLFNNLLREEIIDVKISKNRKQMADKTKEKLRKMFMPKLRVQTLRNYTSVNKQISQKSEELDKFIINENLLNIIKENQRLTNSIKGKNDISLLITTIRRYYTFVTLDYVGRLSNRSRFDTSLMMDEKMEEFKNPNKAFKIIEGTDELLLFDKENAKMNKIKLPFDKKKHLINCFLPGCRSVLQNDFLYITGGKDSLEEKKAFLAYNIKENKLIKLADMKNSRSYHSMKYHDNLKSIIVVGGENNSTAETYDFYLNLWNALPDMNVPRANPSIFIDRVGTFAYSICGIFGNITTGSYTDAIECLDLVDMGQGWTRIDCNNKANIDLKQNEIKIFELTDNKLVIYGAHEVRTQKKCYAILDLKNFDLYMVNKELLEQIRIKISTDISS